METQKQRSTLLVVDDEEANRDLLSRRLQKAGFDVENAASAREALEVLKKENIELVLLDNMMPEVNGLELLKLLRAVHSPSELPVIMVTALAESGRIVEALSAGANDYVTKPIDFPVTLARIVSQLERKRAEREVREREERYALASLGANEGIWDWNLSTGEMFYSERWREVAACGADLGNKPEEWIERIHPAEREKVLSELARLRQPGQGEELECEHRMLSGDGRYRWMHVRASVSRSETGEAIRMVGSHKDITREKMFDGLTGLPNRELFSEMVIRAAAAVEAGKIGPFAVMIVDLDRFKLVNDGLGRKAGDKLLVEVGRRIASVLRRGGAVADHLGWVPTSDEFTVAARLGEDEFAVMAGSPEISADAGKIAQRIMDEIALPIGLDSRTLFLKASIGLTLSNLSGLSAETILRDADTAMYRAKTLGRGTVAMYDASLRARAADRMELETGLREAIAQGQILVFYQANVELKSSRVCGFEALVRWRHPSRGLVPPDLFIGIAEETGLIIPLGLLVLREACITMRRWRLEFPRMTDLEISVNVSVRQFRDPTLVSDVKRILEETGLEPSALHLEITESVLIENMEETRRVFAEIKALGVGLKLDDFGTGYSSLQYLTSLPFDSLKIDKSFLTNLCRNEQASEVVRTVLELANKLQMQVVAEGIETHEQFERLRILECGHGQGYLFSRPVPAAEARMLLAAQQQRDDRIEPAA